MKKAIASGLIGLIALGGGAALAVPSALAQVDEDAPTRQERAAERAQERSDRLDALVENGSITQEQADEIRARFEERAAARQARHDTKVETLTSVLGVTEADLQAAREAGQSIADVAAAQGVDVQTVIDALVADANTNLDAKVADGTIDAERAAEISDNLVERITARVNGERPEGHDGDGPGRGRRGLGGLRGLGAAAGLGA